MPENKVPNSRYLTILDQIYHTHALVPRISRIMRLEELVRLRWPDGYPAVGVQVVGTSGKGSTCRFLAAALQANSRRVGVVASPHVFDYTERISVMGRDLSQVEVTDIWEQEVLPTCIRHYREHGITLGFGEVTLLLALIAFERHQVDFAVIEAGCGGRYDASSALNPTLRLLTNVGEDHQDLLGAQPWQRALEKLGDLRGVDCLITSEDDPELVELILRTCGDSPTDVVLLSDKDHARLHKPLAGAPASSRILLHGPHQRRNACLALRAAEYLTGSDFSEEAALRALESVTMLGRMTEIVPNVFVDIAHNPNKMEALAERAGTLFSGRKVCVVFGVTSSRDARKVIAPILSLADRLIITQARYRGQDGTVLARNIASLLPASRDAQVASVENVADLATRWISETGGVVIITGSTFVIDEILNDDPYLKHLNASCGWRVPRNLT